MHGCKTRVLPSGFPVAPAIGGQTCAVKAFLQLLGGIGNGSVGADGSDKPVLFVENVRDLADWPAQAAILFSGRNCHLREAAAGNSGRARVKLPHAPPIKTALSFDGWCGFFIYGENNVGYTV